MVHACSARVILCITVSRAIEASTHVTGNWFSSLRSQRHNGQKASSGDTPESKGLDIDDRRMGRDSKPIHVDVSRRVSPVLFTPPRAAHAPLFGIHTVGYVGQQLSHRAVWLR